MLFQPQANSDIQWKENVPCALTISSQHAINTGHFAVFNPPFFILTTFLGCSWVAALLRTLPRSSELQAAASAPRCEEQPSLGGKQTSS
ncbi:hypothetical protein BJY01DRAFT_220241 [Aspergillus pseudoustus]|uniref:Uncharacterized protein n=1 Tax=Aspergillus pseudoustus TaxID=1810923 RepID=A0ABR4JDH4_9EURO